MARLFDTQGMMVIPEPIQSDNIKDGKVIVITNVYCQKGHSLIDKKAMFNKHPGIVLNVEQSEKKGKIALSPIVGDKARICLDIDLEEGKTINMFCPECGIELPVHSPCDACDKDLLAMFLTPSGDFNNCIAVCNKVGCPKANIISSGELVAISHLDVT